jgi:hypothetical protein
VPANAKLKYQAEVTRIENGARSRPAFATATEAKLETAKSVVLQAALDKAVDQQTFAEAGNSLCADLRKNGYPEVAKGIEGVLRRRIVPLVGQKLVRHATLQWQSEIANALIAGATSVNMGRDDVVIFCRVLRHAFGDLSPPARYPRHLPGISRVTASYGSSVVRLNSKPIPIGRELDIRLDLSTGVLRIVFMLTIEYGLRISEALALREGDLDLEGKWLTVNGTINRKGERSDPKTGAGKRDIPLDDEHVEILSRWLSQGGGGSLRQIVSDSADKLYLHAEVERLHEEFQMTNCGVRYTFHRYRAACVTTWLVAGMDLTNIKRWIGHKHLRTTIEVYCHAIAVADELWRKINIGADQTDAPAERVRRELMGV